MKAVGIPDVELNARKIRRCHLIEIQAGSAATYFRFTDNNTGDVTTSLIDGASRTFARQFFVLGQIAASIEADENTEVTFLDINDVIRGIAYAYDMRRWPVRIWECWFDAVGAITGVEPLLIGVSSGIELPEGDANRAVLGVVASEFDYDAPGPSMMYTPDLFPFAPVPGAKFTWGPYTETVRSRPVWKVSTD